MPPTYLGPSREEVVFGLYDHWREGAERRMVRAIEFASKPGPTWDAWPCDWEKEAVDSAKVLMSEARRLRLYPTTAQLEEEVRHSAAA